MNLPLEFAYLNMALKFFVCLLQRFVSNEFSSKPSSSTTKSEFFPTLVLNDSLFELKLIDLPAIPFFPSSTDVEWKEFRYFGLRSASAYILVYDCSRPRTFQYVRSLREQMVESRDMTNVPVIVAANKADLVYQDVQMQQGQQQGARAVAGGGTGSGTTTLSKEVVRERKEVSQLVKKTWRAIHVECSAKYNWNVVTVFKELAVTLDMVANGQMLGGPQTNTKKRRCLMF